jgi:hypothetical protein
MSEVFFLYAMHHRCFTTGRQLEGRNKQWACQHIAAFCKN